MNTTRADRTTYIAAFILGALIALLLAAPTRAAEPAGDAAARRPGPTTGG